MRESDLNTILSTEKYHLMQHRPQRQKRVEIYEGDIVRNELHEVFLVEYWGEHWFGYILKKARASGGHLYDDEYEIIGNIYDNPDPGGE